MGSPWRPNPIWPLPEKGFGYNFWTRWATNVNLVSILCFMTIRNMLEFVFLWLDASGPLICIFPRWRLPENEFFHNFWLSWQTWCLFYVSWAVETHWNTQMYNLIYLEDSSWHISNMATIPKMCTVVKTSKDQTDENKQPMYLKKYFLLNWLHKPKVFRIWTR